MSDRDLTFVLGAQDPEMRKIQKALTRAGRRFMHAAKNGQRVSPRSAYEANGVVLQSRGGLVSPKVLPPNAPAALVECTVLGHAPILRVDHHHPGDPGYESAAGDYMAGSSLGQVLAMLEMEPTMTQRLLAAADHCLTAAYQGQCPGIDPHELQPS